MITNFGETLKADGCVIDALKNGVAVPYSYPILNEWNKVVSHIAIESEGIAHLRRCLIDLRERYDSFQQPLPKRDYVDCGCCSGSSAFLYKS